MKDFSDIINLPHFVSSKRPQMSMMSRAAQFSSFAVLSGYEDEVDEVARLTDSLKDMTEDDQDELNKAFCRLMESESERPLVTVSYFKPDSKKSGGKYLTYTGNFRFYDEAERKLKFADGMIIDMEYICRIEFAKKEVIEMLDRMIDRENYHKIKKMTREEMQDFLRLREFEKTVFMRL